MKTQIYQKKINNCTTKEDVAKLVQRSCTQEFEKIVKNIKSNILWFSYYQGQIVQRSCTQKLNKKERFVNMVLKFAVNKSTIVFKIGLCKLIDNYLRIKSS